MNGSMGWIDDGRPSEVAKMRLGNDGDGLLPTFFQLDEEALNYVGGCLEKVGESGVRSLEVADEVCEKGERVELLRQKIHDRFSDTVFREKLYENPPQRGTFEYAYITLIDGAVPTRKKLL